eukprot:comp24159_c0_seq1/m.44019 comp24159_c0_seq1/g.44019  ORF comp24159_c0_seq1/g.44019 comp24159_c0_seq1/m.44019 type:complete len:833 (-) comp24159_c0_seq1:225-2723(-)
MEDHTTARLQRLKEAEEEAAREEAERRAAREARRKEREERMRKEQEELDRSIEQARLERESRRAGTPIEERCPTPPVTDAAPVPETSVSSEPTAPQEVLPTEAETRANERVSVDDTTANENSTVEIETTPATVTSEETSSCTQVDDGVEQFAQEDPKETNEPVSAVEGVVEEEVGKTETQEEEETEESLQAKIEAAATYEERAALRARMRELKRLQDERKKDATTKTGASISSQTKFIRKASASSDALNTTSTMSPLQKSPSKQTIFSANATSPMSPLQKSPSKQAVFPIAKSVSASSVKAMEVNKNEPATAPTPTPTKQAAVVPPSSASSSTPSTTTPPVVVQAAPESAPAEGAEELTEEQLQAMIDQAETYEERSELRARLRALKAATPSTPQQQQPAQKQAATKELSKSASSPSIDKTVPAKSALPEVTLKSVKKAELSPLKKSESTGTVLPKISTQTAVVSSVSVSTGKLSRDDMIRCCVSWINVALGQSIDSSESALKAAVRDGTLLCRLCNKAVWDTVDERAINTRNLESKEKVHENFTLLLNSGRGIGCSFGSIREDDLLAGSADAILTVCMQLAKAAATRKVAISYTNKQPTRQRCVACSNSPATHYATLSPTQVVCGECLHEPSTVFSILGVWGSPKNATDTTTTATPPQQQPSSSKPMHTVSLDDLDSYEARAAARARARMEEQRANTSAAKDLFKKADAATNPTPRARSPMQATGGPQAALLRWVQAKTFGYDGVDVRDFSESWNNGLAFCALMATLVGDEQIGFEKLTAGNKAENFERAFKVAEANGVPRFLDVADMVAMTRPDPFSVMTYVSSIYQALK